MAKVSNKYVASSIPLLVNSYFACSYRVQGSRLLLLPPSRVPCPQQPPPLPPITRVQTQHPVPPRRPPAPTTNLSHHLRTRPKTRTRTKDFFPTSQHCTKHRPGQWPSVQIRLLISLHAYLNLALSPP